MRGLRVRDFVPPSRRVLVNKAGKASRCPQFPQMLTIDERHAKTQKCTQGNLAMAYAGEDFSCYDTIWPRDTTTTFAR